MTYMTYMKPLELLEILDPAATIHTNIHKSFRPFGTDGKHWKTTIVQLHAMLVNSCSSAVLRFHILRAVLGRKAALYRFAWCFSRQGRLTACWQQKVHRQMIGSYVVFNSGHIKNIIKNIVKISTYFHCEHCCCLWIFYDFFYMFLLKVRDAL